jgi:ribonuclease P protein component
VRRAFVLQMAEQPAPPPDTDTAPLPAVRFGFTASRKIGNAVARNRARRRLREAARAVMPGRVVDGFDYVLVARAAVLTCRYADLLTDLASALAELAKAPLRRPRPAQARDPAPTAPSSGPSADRSSGAATAR